MMQRLTYLKYFPSPRILEVKCKLIVNHFDQNLGEDFDHVCGGSQDLVREGDWRSEEIKVYRSVDASSLFYDIFLNLKAKGICVYNQANFHFSPKISQASTTFFK